MRDFSVARRSCACFWSETMAAVAVAVLAIGVAACSPNEPLRSEGAAASATALNSNPQITNFAVYAQNSATLQDRATVTGGDVGVRVAGSGPFLVSGYELALVADAQVDTTHNVMANRLLLQDRAHVGDIQVNHEDHPNGGSYTHKYPFPSSMPALPPLAPVSPGTEPLTVNGSSTFTASPGSYGTVSVGYRGILRLRGGVYHLASLQLDNEAHVEALAPVQVRVAGRFSALDRVQIVAAHGVTLTAGDLRIEVSGRNGSSGSLSALPKAAAFGNDSVVHAVMLVPNGTLLTGHRATMVGAYVARDVYVDIDAKVTYQSGVGPSGCLQSCDDGNPCTTDTCSAGACGHAFVASGTSCADGNACNGGETCDVAGHCQAGTPVSCPVPDQCHTAGACNPATGQCSNPAKPDLTACDDGNAESQGDACTAGVCQGTISCSPVAEVRVGEMHTCAVRTDGSLWCWGDNAQGQLGNGTTDPSWIPVRAGSATWNWTSVTAGEFHSCGIRRDGTLWCWGENAQGRLGNGTNDPASTPTQVAGEHWTMVQAGLSYTCGVQSNGSLWCWGDNQHGALGNGTQSNSSVPVEVVGMDWVSVASGGWHTCGIKADQTLWCWGGNIGGELGNGSKVASLTPVQIGGANWSSVAAGLYHTCGVKLDGGLWCWGANDSGQLGIGSNTGSSTPVRVGSAAWTNVSAGALHSCGVRADGTLWCWGSNDHGQVGDGTLVNRLAPVRVPGQAWAQVAAGNWHTCGRRQDESLWCWGNDAEGEIGDGQGGARLLPEQVVGELCSQVPLCGDGHTEGSEECDDGNNDSGDGCTMDCQVEKCFGKTCEAMDKCHHPGICDPATGNCPTGSPVECKDTNECHPIGTCEMDTGSCAYPIINKVGCNAHLRADGVAKMSDGKYVAIFGYDSSAAASFRPGTNSVSGQSGTTPLPPAYLLPGTHIGAFLPILEGTSISWTVDSETVTVSYDPNDPSTVLTPEPIGTGSKVDLPDGTTVMVKPDLSPYEKTPADPGIHGDLPTGTEFKGTIPAQLTVGPTGAAIYTVPISIPPGIAGMAPNLNLVYNSQAGNGIAGQGWDLTGLSVIHRCPKTKLQDGYAQPVNIDATPVTDDHGDGVCLDGKRLLYSTDSGTFKTEMEDFSKITLDAAGEVFKVVTKSGETRYYGSQPGARVHLPMEDANGIIKSDAGSNTVIVVWALDKVVDVWGNYFEIHYNQNQDYTSDRADFSDRGLIVTGIDYTGHQAESPDDETLPFYSVRFAYETRPDVRHTRFRDSMLPRNQRLKSITTKRGVYSLTYAANECLETIGYCTSGDNPACLRPLYFAWGFGMLGGPDNSPRPIDWTAAPAFQLPTDQAGPGTQFVDLDADGRLDFVQAITGYGQPSQAWRNTGQGWQPKENWQLPPNVYLTYAWQYKTYGVMFADFDGDGLPDLISDSWDGSPAGPAKPAIWLNQSRTEGATSAWALQTGNRAAERINALLVGNKLDLKPQRDKVADIDGDGKAEVVRIEKGTEVGGNCGIYATCYYYGVGVFHFESGGWTLEHAIQPGPGQPYVDHRYDFIAPDCDPDSFVLTDVNRDGLPDLVLASGNWAVLNTGKFGSGGYGNYKTIWKYGGDEFSGVGIPTGRRDFLAATGDIDGDGVYDQVSVHWREGDENANHRKKQLPDPDASSATHIFFGAGWGWTTQGPAGYLDALKRFENWPIEELDPDLGTFIDGRYQLADLNADGLVDLIVNRSWGGQMLINNGSSWIDLDGHTSYENSTPGTRFVPHALAPTEVAPYYCDWNRNSELCTTEVQGPFDAFIDLNGDGVTDRIQTLTRIIAQETIAKGAWRNTYSPPVIQGFPNGNADLTKVQYVTIITPEAASIYYDTPQLDEGTKYMALPLRVVASFDADSGLDGPLATTTTTKYRYWDLRASASARGPQGFRQIEVTDPTGMVTLTTYAQAYPYTGLPTLVQRSNVTSVSKTKTEYCDNVAADGDSNKCTPVSTGTAAGTNTTGVFVYPMKVTDTSYLLDSNRNRNGAVTTTTEYVYDGYGNPTSTTVTTTGVGRETYEKTISSNYGADQSLEQRRGKPKQTVVTSRKVAADGTDSTRIHTTEFEYDSSLTPPTLALTKKKVEPGAGLGIELHTAYEYDRFGNLTATTSCASDFDYCEAGADSGADPNDPDHQPFRTTWVSYDPVDRDPAPAKVGGAVPKFEYGIGRYPVRTTNALNHVEYSAYDPLLGVLIESTGPNGIHTCYEYDRLGYQQSETARCGSDHELKTTITRCLIESGNPFRPVNKTLTVTQLPTGAVSGVYADRLGRPIQTFARHFSGGFTYANTEYDGKGRVSRKSKPFLEGDTEYSTTVQYDWLGRTLKVEQELGHIDGEATPKTSLVTTKYSGANTSTEETVHNETRTRTEWKNVLGKVASVEDKKESMSYSYDADGNLTDTEDGGQSKVHIEYDVLGRKTLTTDGDLGTWTYGYNGFGDLIRQTGAKGQNAATPTTTMTYDELGRMISKTDATGTAEWVYDTVWKGKLAAMISAPDPKLNAACSVPNTTQTSGNRAGRWFTYTLYGEVDEVTECADGESFSTKYQYDEIHGRQSGVTYPDVNGSRFAVEYYYTSLGFLQYVADGSDHKPYWVATEMNAAGQVTGEEMRNGVKTTSTRNPSTGWLLGSTAIAQANDAAVIQDWKFTYDEAGNLRSRAWSMPSEMPDSIETFDYDMLDRLTQADVKIPSAPWYDRTENYTYENNGNVATKNGHPYTYGNCNAGPHAVCQVGGGALFEYDANGNMTSGNERSVEYNPANKPIHIARQASSGNAAATVDFVYGADGHRVLQDVRKTDDGESARTVYVGLGATGKSIYERTTRVMTVEKAGHKTSETSVEHVHFLYAGGAHGGNAFALYVSTRDDSGKVSAEATKYNHFDHLGSVTAMSDSEGRVLGPTWGGADATVFAYDAWGARRNPDANSAGPTSFNPQVGHREFTSHEAIPNVGLVNMNGRVYDPELGRFLTPDPNVQFVANPQNYNRYSYAVNNPLRYTDPTGYGLFDDIFLGVFEVAFMTVGCAAGPAGCIAATLMVTGLNTTTAVMNGASFEQVVLGIGFGALSSGFGLGAGAAAGALAGSIIGGVASVAVSAAMTTAMTNGGWGALGKNLLIGAAFAAEGAGIAWSLQATAPVSQDSAARQQGALHLDDEALGLDKAGSSDALGEPATEKSFRKALKDIGYMGKANKLSNAGWKVGFFEPGTIETSIDGGATIQTEGDTAVGWTLHDKRTILIKSGMSVEKSVLTFAHEYEHAFGGGEREAFAGMARASLALKQIGGVSANSAYMQQFMTNATVDLAKINTYVTTRETTAGDLYSKQILGVHPASWERVF